VLGAEARLQSIDDDDDDDVVGTAAGVNGILESADSTIYVNIESKVEKIIRRAPRLIITGLVGKKSTVK
jgi:hypothetical protein